MEFYRQLSKVKTSQTKDRINYISVQHFTDKYNSDNPYNHSVFNRFDRLVFVIPPLSELETY